MKDFKQGRNRIELYFEKGTLKILEMTDSGKESDWKRGHKLNWPFLHLSPIDGWGSGGEKVNLITQFNQEMMRALVKEESMGMEKRE